MRDDIDGAEPGDLLGVVARGALARDPAAAHRNERVVKAHASLFVAVDRVDDGQDAGRLGDDSGLFEKLAHRPLGDGLAQFEHAARKAPATGQRRGFLAVAVTRVPVSPVCKPARGGAS